MGCSGGNGAEGGKGGAVEMYSLISTISKILSFWLPRYLHYLSLLSIPMAGRYDSNPFDKEEKVNPFFVSHPFSTHKFVDFFFLSKLGFCELAMQLCIGFDHFQ